MSSLKRCVALGVVASMLGSTVGCATASKDIASASVSPMQYHTYDCTQLSSEYQRVGNRVTDLGGQLDTKASNDKAKVAIGVVLFWPALLFLDGKNPQEGEFSRLKGEAEALQITLNEKKCGTMVVNAQPALETAHMAMNPIREVGVGVGPADSANQR